MLAKQVLVGISGDSQKDRRSLDSQTDRKTQCKYEAEAGRKDKSPLSQLSRGWLGGTLVANSLVPSIKPVSISLQLYKALVLAT